MAKILTSPNASEAMEQQELLFIDGGDSKCYTSLEDSMAVSYKTQHTLTIWSINHTPCYLSKEAINLSPHKTCTQTFMAALFVSAKTWQQSRYHSVCE